MKYFVLFVFSLFLVISCSDNKNETMENVKAKICSRLKDNPTPEGILQAGRLFENEFGSKYELSEKKLADYLVKLRPCFAEMGFTKEIKPMEEALQGEVSDYLALKKDVLKIVLKNVNAPAFSVDMEFTGLKKYTDSEKPEIGGSFVLFDKDKKELAKYNVYPVPDFYLTMEKGSGDFKFTVYLDAVWYPYGDKPFVKAAEYLQLMGNAEYYKMVLDLKNSKKSKQEEEKDDEILDNLQILSAPNN